jgi:hypothetical protein
MGCFLGKPVCLDSERGESRSADGVDQTAAAPPTISEISWVIAAWRALL